MTEDEKEFEKYLRANHSPGMFFDKADFIAGRDSLRERLLEAESIVVQTLGLGAMDEMKDWNIVKDAKEYLFKYFKLNEPKGDKS